MPHLYLIHTFTDDNFEVQGATEHLPIEPQENMILVIGGVEYLILEVRLKKNIVLNPVSNSLWAIQVRIKRVEMN